MKTYLILIGLLFTGGLFAQQTPEFEFQLYFEDAAGNKDTITLGYDVNATDSIDTSFDEVDIVNLPWENGLDVRIGKSRFLPNTEYLSKRQILAPFCDPNIVNQFVTSEEATIHFYTLNYPISIKWNKSLFENESCIRKSIIYDEFHGFDIEGYAILADPIPDSIIIDSNMNTQIGGPLETYMDSNKKIGLLKFRFAQESTSGIKDEALNINLFPNPISRGDFLNVNVVGEYQIVNRLGQTVQEGEIKNGRIPVNTNESGLYILRIQEVNNKQYTTKIIIR